MKRILAGVVVLTVALAARPAEAQFGNPWWGRDLVYVEEAAGEVVLTLEFGGTGNVKYRTIDGDCVSSTCDRAEAPGDYTAVSGEVVFASPGSRTIRIPIVDDRLAEAKHEGFAVHAVEEPNPDPFPYGGHRVTVVIVDDDTAAATGPPAAAGAAAPAATTDRRQPAPAGRLPRVGMVAEPAAAPRTEAPPSDLAVELAPGELRPGPGFEVASEDAPAPAPAGAGGGTAPWAVGVTVAAAGVVAAALVQRRRRWSPT